MNFKNIKTEQKNNVGLITLDRPAHYNALCQELADELTIALDDFESNPDIGAIVITGNEKAFSAGADLTEIKNKDFEAIYREQFITDGWERVTTCRKPVIAAVAGYALGGGCEVSMMCDFIIAADNAQFGQPEIKIGTIPGAGGTQRLTRLVGKSKAMDMCLTGRMMDAEEAERSGLVSRIVPLKNYLKEALEIAETIASYSLPVVCLAKEAVDVAYETTLTQGVKTERNLFYSTFALKDQKEGMNAFIEKRKPDFKNK